MAPVFSPGKLFPTIQQKLQNNIAAGKKKRKPGRGISKNPVQLKTADLKKALSRNKQKIAGLIQNDVIYQKSNNNISDKIKV